MKLLEKTQYPQYIEYLVDYYGVVVYARFVDGVLLSSSFKAGNAAEVALVEFCHNN